MRKIKHPNTVRFIDHRQSKNANYIFMEYCSEGDLNKFIPNFNIAKFGLEYEIKTLIESDARYVIREIV